MPHDLRSFIDVLGGRVCRVRQAIDPITDVSAICAESEYPVLFEELKGFPDWRLIDVLVKTRELQGATFQTDSRGIVPWFAERLFAGNVGQTVFLNEGPCQEVFLKGEEADLRDLPVPIHSEGDGGGLGGRYVGSGIAITKDPESGVRNESFLRLQVRDDMPRRSGFWMAARHSYAHFQKYEKRGLSMPMAFVVGIHPAYEVLANYSGRHDHWDEFELAAGILGEPLEMVRCRTIDLEVPARAEVVVEGLVHANVREPEGPFGEFTGYSHGKSGLAPVFETTAISHRLHPIFRHLQATVFTDHQALVQLPVEATLYRRLLDVFGNTRVHDVHVLPWASLFIVVVQVTCQWDGQARSVIHSALSSPYQHPKIVIAVDDDVDIYDPKDVFWAIATRSDPQRDIVLQEEERIHPLDQSVPTIGDEDTILRIGGKMGIDATKPPLWRTKERPHFDRVRPRPAADASVERIAEMVRSFAPDASSVFSSGNSIG